MNIRTKIAAAALAVLASLSVLAEKAAYDGFESADLGALDEQVGGTGFAGAYSADASVTVIARQLVYENGTLKIDGGQHALQLKKSTEANKSLLATRELAESHDEDVFYVSALFYVDKNTRGNNNRDTFWIGLANTNSARPGGGLGAEDTGYFWSGIVGGQSRLSATTVVADSVHFIVAKIHKNTAGTASNYNRVSLMVDPDSAEEPTTWTIANQTASSSTTWPEFGFLNFYMDYSRAEDADKFVVDEIRVGTTWADVVVPYVEPPPEPVDSDTVAHWTGEDAVSVDWAKPGNWEDATSPVGNDVAFDNAGASASDAVTSEISESVAVSSVSYASISLDGGEVKRHTTSIAGDATLSVTGTNVLGSAFSVTAQPLAENNIYNTCVALVGGGALYVDSEDGEFLVGRGYATPTKGRARGFLDLSGLSSVTADVSRLVLGEGIYTRGEMKLAATGRGENFVRAEYVGVGDSAGALGGPETSVLALGPTNVIHAGRINIAATEVAGNTVRNNCASGEMKFAAGLENPTLVVRSKSGSGRADMTVASHGNGSDNWYEVSGRADFSGGTVDMRLGNLLVGAGTGYAGTQTGTVDGYFVMSAGKVDVNAMTLGRSAYYAGGRNAFNTRPAWGRYTMDGGETVVNDSVTLAISEFTNWQGGRQTVKGDLTLNNDSRFTSLGPVVLASDGGYATGAVARVTIGGTSVLSACSGIKNGLRAEGKTDNSVPIVIGEFEGSVFVNGGTLAVTNGAQTSELCLDYGTLSAAGGSVIADKLTMTNTESVVSVVVSGRDAPIVVKGAANVDGARLEVSFADGYTPVKNGSYRLISAGTFSGEFASVSLPDGSVRIAYSNGGVSLAYGGMAIIVR